MIKRIPQISRKAWILAQQNHIDVFSLTPTGPNGRIIEEDVLRAIAQMQASMSAVTPSEEDSSATANSEAEKASEQASTVAEETTEKTAEQPAEAPAEQPAQEAQTSAEEVTAAEETPAEAPAEQPAQEAQASTEETPAEAPAEQPAQEAQASAEETPAEAPAEQPAQEAQASAEEVTAAEETPAEAPEEQSAQEAQASAEEVTAAEETPAEAPAEQPAQEAQASAEEVTAAEETFAEAPAEQSVEEAQTPAEEPAEQPEEEATAKEEAPAAATAEQAAQEAATAEETSAEAEESAASDETVATEAEEKTEAKEDADVSKAEPLADTEDRATQTAIVASAAQSYAKKEGAEKETYGSNDPHGEGTPSYGTEAYRHTDVIIPRTETAPEGTPMTVSMSFDASALVGLHAKLKKNGEAMGIPHVTVNDMILFAAAKLLKKQKALNAHFLGDKIRYFDGVHLGFAVDTERGMETPVIFDADKLSLCALARITDAVIRGAKAGTVPSPKAKPVASFTVLDLGSLGVEYFTPALKAPQTGVLGVCALQRRIREVDGKDVGYSCIPLSLTFDPRALDTTSAAKFLKELCVSLENFELLLIK